MIFDKLSKFTKKYKLSLALSNLCKTRCDVEEISNLIKQGADVNFTPEDEVRSPLYKACQVGNIPVIRVLLENGANPNFLNISDQATPLMVNVHEYSYMKTVSDVIRIKKLDSLEKDFTAITKLLLDHGADPNYENHVGNTIVDYLSVNDIEFIECMIKGGFDIHKVNKNGETLKERTVGKEIFDVALKIDMIHKESLNSDTNFNEPKRIRLRSI